MKPTPYKDINQILSLLKNGLVETLDENLVGIYLTGSLTYGDFDSGSSDIDFLVVMKHTLSHDQRVKVKALHKKIGEAYPLWRKRIEGSYITIKMLSNITPPKDKRPYINADKMWSFVFGNEWIINLFALYQKGIALYGPSPKEIMKPVRVSLVRKASEKNLIDEWVPKLTQQQPFNSADYDTNHLQAYAVLTMCRILYTASNNLVVSKKVAAAWVKQTYGNRWKSLIEKAERWEHGKTMDAQEDVLKFIRFTAVTVKHAD